METKEGNKKTDKPFIIANPIYDTVFKRLMENQRIAKFFLSTILEQQIEEITVLPQEFTYKLDSSKALDKNEDKVRKNTDEYYYIFRLDFMATVLTDEGVRRKILIELQKSWDTTDVMRFRKYLGEQYIRKDSIDGKTTILPITTIYILGRNLSEIDCPCIKVGRTYIDMINKTTIGTKSKFMENLTHDSYVIQACRITDVRYVTNLDKLLSIFEQKYFIVQGSEARKEYPYHPEDENMKLITDILYEMGANPEERKEIESEEEALRVINNGMDPLRQTIEEKDKTIEEKDKTIEEKDKTIEEKDKTIGEQAKSLKEKDKTIEEQAKSFEEQAKSFEEEIAELKRLLQKKQVE